MFLQLCKGKEKKKKKLTTLPSSGQFIIFLFNGCPWYRMEQAESLHGFDVASHAFSSESRTPACRNAEEPVTMWLVTAVSEARQPPCAAVLVFSSFLQSLTVCGCLGWQERLLSTKSLHQDLSTSHFILKQYETCKSGTTTTQISKPVVPKLSCKWHPRGSRHDFWCFQGKRSS